MTVIVHNMDKIYKVKMKHEDDSVDFHFKQLSYSEKSELVTKTVKHSQGIVTQDLNMSDYLAIQMALVKVSGLYKRVLKDQADVDRGVRFITGKNEDLFQEIPYELEFNDEGRVLDRCMDEIFNTPFEDKLIYTSKHLTTGIPDKIIHPFSKEEIAGVEIVMPKGGMPKK